MRLIERLCVPRQKTMLIVSSHGWRLLRTELGIESVDVLRERAGARVWDESVMDYDDADRGALPASGSLITAGMVTCPCSMGTLFAISVGASRSQIERART